MPVDSARMREFRKLLNYETKRGLKVGDNVRDMGKYPCLCDGMVVSTTRFKWILEKTGWYPERMRHGIVVKFDEGHIQYYSDADDSSIVLIKR